MSSYDVANFLRKKARESNLTHTEITRSAGLSRQTWYKLLNGEVQEAKFSTLIRVSHALNIHPLDLMGLYFGQQALKRPTHHSTSEPVFAE